MSEYLQSGLFLCLCARAPCAIDLKRQQLAGALTRVNEKEGKNKFLECVEEQVLVRACAHA